MCSVAGRVRQHLEHVRLPRSGCARARGSGRRRRAPSSQTRCHFGSIVVAGRTCPCSPPRDKKASRCERPRGSWRGARRVRSLRYGRSSFIASSVATGQASRDSGPRASRSRSAARVEMPRDGVAVRTRDPPRVGGEALVAQRAASPRGTARRGRRARRCAPRAGRRARRRCETSSSEPPLACAASRRSAAVERRELAAGSAARRPRARSSASERAELGELERRDVDQAGRRRRRRARARRAARRPS